MVSKNKNGKSVSRPESVILKFMKGIVKAIFWIYALAVLVVIGVSVWLSIQKDFTVIHHLMIFVQIFSTAVLGIMILAILFKILRKRTVILPLLVLGSSFIIQNLVDYLPAVTKEVPRVASYKSKGNIFKNLILRKSNDVNSIGGNNSKFTQESNPHKNSLKIVTEKPISVSDLDKDTTSYANVRGYLVKDRLPPKSSVRVEEMINHFSYHYDLPQTKEQPFVIQTTLTQSPWKKGNQLLHIGIRGYEPEMPNDIQSDSPTIADDTKIQVEFNPEKVAEYHLIGYETLPIELGHNQIDVGKISAGYSVTAIYEITPISPLPANESEGTAWVRVRYKLPGETTSEAIEQVVAETTDLDHTSDDVRFAIAIAAFGEKLKGSQSVDWRWKDIRNFAKTVQNEDKNRYELITLIKKAESLIKAEKYDPNC